MNCSIPLLSMKETIERICEQFKISRPEAELIIATLLGKQRFEVYLNNNLDERVKKTLAIRLAQLKNGVPIEYITKRVQFLKFTLNLYPGVFIPRLETEYFVELISKLCIKEPKQILDLGTGCGAIAIALAEIFLKAKIFATDVSLIALKNALENVKKFHLEDRIYLIGADLFNSINTQFDLIVSNPPYVPSERMEFLPKSVREFEPRRAIDGGYKGIKFIKRIIAQGIKLVTPKGHIALEIDEEEVPDLENFLQNKPLSFFFKKDLFDRYRYLFITVKE